MTLLYILTSALVISFGSLLGVIFLYAKKESIQKWLLYLVALSAGTMLGGAFFHLLPEALESIDNYNLVAALILLSFAFFFIIEKVLHWRHCHEENCKEHTFGYMNLLGDGIHNFIDGVLIAGAFMASFQIGIITSLAIALHEIPQEIGDFGVLLHAGIEKKKAILLNFLTALTAVIGALVGYFISSQSEQIVSLFLPVAFGGFIYIAMSDLVPEIREEKHRVRSLSLFGVFAIGVLIMYASTFLEH